MGIGLFIWCISTALCSISEHYLLLLFFRSLVGIGEASFIALSVPLIDDIAPIENNSKWLAFYFSMIPLGVSFGYMFGGNLAEYYDWRLPFIIESFLMLPFAISTTLYYHKFIPDDINVITDNFVENDDNKNMLDKIKELMLNRIYLTSVLGYSAYTFILGIYGFWGIEFISKIYNISISESTIILGILTTLTGIFGTMFGGYLLDTMGNNLKNANFISYTSIIFGGLSCYIAFNVNQLWLFIIFMFIGEFLIFTLTAPLNIIFLCAVPKNYRSLSCALSIIFIHLLGDIPSPPIAGIIQDKTNNWQLTLNIVSLTFFVIIGFFL